MMIQTKDHSFGFIFANTRQICFAIFIYKCDEL